MPALTAGQQAWLVLLLSLYVGRDTENLKEPEILRAVLETVTENTDGVMVCFMQSSGQLYRLWRCSPGSSVQSRVPWIQWLAISAVLFRVVQCATGGWADLVALSVKVLTLALMSGRPQHVWRLCRRDAIKDPSQFRLE